MISKACQLLNPYLLKDLVKMVDAFLPEHLLCEQLIDMIMDGRVLMQLDPAAARTGFKRFVIGTLSKMPGFTYSTPPECILYIEAVQKKDDKDLEIMLTKLDQIDDTQVVNPDNYGYWDNRLGFACDTTSMVYQHLNHHDLIEKAVPQWYREGEF
jgi:hypothetical protein